MSEDESSLRGKTHPMLRIRRAENEREERLRQSKEKSDQSLEAIFTRTAPPWPMTGEADEEANQEEAPSLGAPMNAGKLRRPHPKQSQSELADPDLIRSLWEKESELADRDRLLRRAKAMIAERERSLKEQEKLIEARERFLKETEKLFNEQQQQVQSILENYRSGKEDESVALAVTPNEGINASLETMKKELDERESSLRERERILREREKFIEESENTLFEKAQELQEREAEIEQREENLPPPPEDDEK